MAGVLLRGFILGFVIAASPGPIFFLCLRRTLARGWPAGLASGFGVATADGFYAAVAAFGIGAISTFLVGERRWLALIGSSAESAHSAALQLLPSACWRSSRP